MTSPPDLPTLEDRSEVTLIIKHDIKGGKQAAYEEWLSEIVPLAAQYPGHRGVNVIRPTAGATEYTVVLHFDRIEHLQTWLDSDVRRRMVEKARPIFAGDDHVEIKTGLEFWFTPPSKPQRARPYKQFMVTLSVIYPLTLIVPVALGPLIDAIPFPVSSYIRQVVIDAIIVGLITYVVMPRYVRLIARWLYK